MSLWITQSFILEDLRHVHDLRSHSCLFQHVIYEFQYGQQYAWVLCVFAMIVAYSISCPLIVPFGKFLLKHYLKVPKFSDARKIALIILKLGKKVLP